MINATKAKLSKCYKPQPDPSYTVASKLINNYKLIAIKESKKYK